MSVFQGPVLKHLAWMCLFQGTLLKHLEEHVIQSNMTQEDIMLYYTTVSQVTLPALTGKLQLHSINSKPHSLKKIVLVPYTSTVAAYWSTWSFL